MAVQARRAGVAAAYFGAVGPDDDGDLVRRSLEQEGVDVGGLVVRPGNTSVTQIEVRRDGERVLAHEDFGVCRGYAPDAQMLSRLIQADHVHLGWLDDGGALRRRLALEGRSVSQDLTVNADPRNLGVEGLTIAFGSHPGTADDAERLGREWLGQGARMAVVTRGADGAAVIAAEGRWHIPAERVDPVDTTGAGDSFIAGFIAAWLRGAPPEAAARSGARQARLTCLHEGGFPQHGGDWLRQQT
ncbi:putative sugar kinase protein [Rubellimicrobium mesophilum DSM 19309]|uniref:Putative sugar kinase protein n=1 Tax=Rubellimicrobium mesophilum DSM 19309 TaxID=442562 RepID=A0A017HN59_9RHOB|nr:putative sugar kinase protein [Rubellimicrobium mesophilum DSM 19309]